MKRMKLMTARSVLLALLPAAVFVSNTLPATPQAFETSCADCPNYSGAFSIENTTKGVITYQMRWGEQDPWKQFVLKPGNIETHSYPLGEDRLKKVPTPHVRFDMLPGASKEYDMEFYAVGYAGYGPSANTTKPKRYLFKVRSLRAGIDLFNAK